MAIVVNTSAEQAVLTALIQEPALYAEKVAHRVPDADIFTDPLHAEIFRSIQSLVGSASGPTLTPFDAHSVAADLERRGKNDLSAPNGESPRDYLITMHTAPPVASLTESLAAMTEAYVRSKASEALDEASLGITDPNADAKSLINGLNSSLSGIVNGLNTEPPGVKSLAEIAAMTVSDILTGSSGSTLPTGYTELDDLLDGGLIAGALYVVGARPSVGKSAFALDCARHMAIREKKNVLFLNMEMRPQDLFIRLISAEGTMPASELTRAIKTPGGAPAHIAERLHSNYALLASKISYSDDPLAEPTDDKGNLWVWSPYQEMGAGKKSAADVGAILTQMTAVGQVDVVIVDYLQLLGPMNRNESRQQDVAETVRTLKELALQFNLPMIVLSQVNRGSADRADKRPMLSDLRESGEIEQASDVVVLLHNEGKARGDDPMSSVLEVHVAKNRHGRDGRLTLIPELDFCRFATPDPSLHAGFDGFESGF